MNLRTVVWKELRERPTAMATCVLAILLGVTALVAIRHITVFSEREVARQMETLGANILILPKEASLQDYYAADLNGQTLPESHVSQVLLASLPGVEKLSPKLCVPVQLGDRKVTLTGILPQSEFQAKAAWQTVSLFGKNKSTCCAKAKTGPTPEDLSPESLATVRTVEALAETDVIVGADAAAELSLRPGSSVELLEKTFRVAAVLPRTGTVDDSRVFAHLHQVQEAAKSGEVVNAIEVMGCCEDAAGKLVPELSKLLPDAKVVTISQVVQAQVGVNRLMSRSSVFVLGVLVLVGGVGVASSISANVRERRREIGTLMALGAAPNLVLRMFLLKAAWLGFAGGIGGVAAGTVLAVLLGPRWAGVDVSPLPGLAALSLTAALGITLVSAYWPARQAARLDPCVCFQEV